MNPHSGLYFVVCLCGLVCFNAPLRGEIVGELESVARTSNADVLKARAELDAAMARVPQAKSLPNPAIEVETMGAEAVGSSQTARLGQAFPWPGTLGFREAEASLQARAYWHEVQAIELQVRLRVQAIAAEIAYLRKEADLIRQNLNLFDKQEDFLEQASRGGGEVSDLVRVEMESGLIGDEFAMNVELVERQVAELEVIVGRELSAGEVDQISMSALESIPRDRESLVARLEATNPLLQSLDSRVEAARAGVELARLETYPDFMVSAGYRRVAEPTMEGSKEWMNEAVLMFTIGLPVWGEKNQGARDEAASMLEVAVQERESASRQLRAQLDIFLSRERDAIRRSELFKAKLLPKARQAHEAVEASYRGGRANLLDVFDSRRRLLETETGYWRAVADGHVSRAEIDALFGTDPQIRKP